ncbi:GIY-YIG_COG3680 domain containing protein [uncultured Caudovirales phage]|uniref:GIY-YIG_COG3680 domain containing protein n=1 Tax=uncultured Caudovirales phage TaxID=2100421 RepID=A0A6J5LCY5_9CAUD|nr:GIY-YIG_COG3680 domain containing protein [uncultured Caudovirales phage]
MSLQSILAIAESKKFYVYLHLRKDTNKPFYVGKGCGQRAYTKQGRNKYWKAVADKHGYDVKIIQENLTETQALNSEKFAISILSNHSTLTNSCFGGGGITGWKHTEETKTNQRIGLLNSYTPELLEIRKQKMLQLKVAQRPEVKAKMAAANRDYLKGANNHEAVAIKCNDVIYPTIRAMCQQEQIKLSTFKYWRKNNQLAKRGIEIL